MSGTREQTAEVMLRVNLGQGLSEAELKRLAALAAELGSMDAAIEVAVRRGLKREEEAA